MAVTNTDGDNPRKEIQVSVSLIIKEPLPMPLVEQQRLGEVGRQHGRKVLLVDLQDTVIGKRLRTENSSASETFLLPASTFSQQQVTIATPRSLLTEGKAAAPCASGSSMQGTQPFLLGRGRH